MNQEKRPVALEDLLRLKRAERPPAEFWDEFDRQLRAKQLAALVEKRPWWHGLQQAFSRVGRYQVAFGAAAVVAITFVSTRDTLFRSPQQAVPQAAQPVAHEMVAASEPSVGVAGADVAVSNISNETSLANNVAPATVSVAREVGVEFTESVASPQTSAPSFVAVADERAAREMSVISPVEAITASSVEAEPTSPSARFIAANFAAAQAADPVAVSLLTSTHGFESRAMPERAAAIDPLQQMTPPGELRRPARYLAAMVSTTVDENPTRTTERVASRISTEELYDQVRRFGARQGGFNVKF